MGLVVDGGMDGEMVGRDGGMVLATRGRGRGFHASWRVDGGVTNGYILIMFTY